MLASGVILIAALAGKYAAEWEPEQSSIQADAKKQWFAKGLASWIRYSYGAEEQKKEQKSEADWMQQDTVGRKIISWIGKWSPLVCFYELYQDGGEDEAEADPSYTRYLDKQRVMKESAYLYLFGDENSGSGKEDIVIEGAQGEEDQMAWFMILQG